MGCRDQAPSTSVSLFEIFQPGLRHLREERDRQKTLVARPTPGGGAPLGIDLDSGTAVIPAGAGRPSGPAEVGGGSDVDPDDAPPGSDTTDEGVTSTRRGEGDRPSALPPE
jgi:hypothetical protein